MAAVAELFDSMSEEVRNAFQGLTDASPTEPLIEDVFWEIWRTAARFTPDSDSAYRWVIGKVACRVRAHAGVSSTAAEPEDIWRAMGPAGSGSAVHFIISDLSLQQLRISAQCLFLGMSVQQVAEANGMAPAEVMTTLEIVQIRLSAGAAHAEARLAE